jgi:hypothetical protein
MKKKGLGYEILIRIVIAVMFIILAITVGRSCAEAVIPQTNEAHESFDDFAEFLKTTKDWTPGTSETKLLIMDESTMILGFSKGAGFIEKHTGRDTLGENLNINLVSGTVDKIVRPSRACGDRSACLCQCSGFPEFNDELGYHVCGELRCHQMQENINFHGRIALEKLVPEGYRTIWALDTNKEDSFVLGGFFIERFSSKYPSNYPHFVVGYNELGLRVVADRKRVPPFPRRMEVTIKKQSDGDLLICPQQSCS